MSNEWNQNGYDRDGDRETEYAFQTLRRNGRPKSLGWSVASLVMGIIAAITSSFGWSSIILGALAIVFAILSRRMLGYFDGKSVAGLILGIFGAVFGAVMIVYAITLGEEDQKYLWDLIKQMFSDVEGGGPGSSF